MFHVVIECQGLHPPDRLQASRDIVEEFTHRLWHQDVSCAWVGENLRIEAHDDFDADGLALRDEFSDAIVASVANAEYTDLRVISVTEISS